MILSSEDRYLSLSMILSSKDRYLSLSMILSSEDDAKEIALKRNDLKNKTAADSGRKMKRKRQDNVRKR